MKKIFIFAIIAVALLAVSVYRAKQGARESEAQIRALKEEVARQEEELSVLKAEEAHLSRPERIGPLARETLGLQPARPDQFMEEGALNDHIEQEAASAGAGIPTEAPQ